MEARSRVARPWTGGRWERPGLRPGLASELALGCRRHHSGRPWTEMVHRHGLDVGRELGQGAQVWGSHEIEDRDPRDDPEARVEAIRYRLGGVRAGRHDPGSLGRAECRCVGFGILSDIRTREDLGEQPAADALFLLFRQDVELREEPHVLALDRHAEADDLLARLAGLRPASDGDHEALRIRGQEMLEKCQQRIQIRRGQRPVEPGHVLVHGRVPDERAVRELSRPWLPVGDGHLSSRPKKHRIPPPLPWLRAPAPPA